VRNAESCALLHISDGVLAGRECPSKDTIGVKKDMFFGGQKLQLKVWQETPAQAQGAFTPANLHASSCVACSIFPILLNHLSSPPW